MAQVITRPLKVAKKYCSNCRIYHRTDGTPCGSCFRLKCPECDAKSPAADPFVCRACHHRFKLSRKQRHVVVHQMEMTNCPRPNCGRKLRTSSRDKRRHEGKKS